MGFPFNLYLAAFLAALVTSVLAFPFWRKWCIATNHMDDPGHRKIHHTPIPLAGGLTVATAFLLPLLAGYILVQGFGSDLFRSGIASSVLQAGFSRRTIQVAAILVGALGMVFLGWLDDRHELSPKIKFAGQLLIALAVAWSGIRITLFVENALFTYCVTVLWILTLTNAFNFMDSMNGLCTGLGIISAWACAWSAHVQSQPLVALLGFLICGALLGFFPFNFPRASAFLGDAGSHLTGFLISVLVILPTFYSAPTSSLLAVLTPLFIVALPLADLVWVVILRWRMRQPFYVGDNNHLSHRLVRRGLTQSTAVLLILLLNALSAAFALLVLS